MTLVEKSLLAIEPGKGLPRNTLLINTGQSGKTVDGKPLAVDQAPVIKTKVTAKARKVVPADPRAQP